MMESEDKLPGASSGPREIPTTAEEFEDGTLLELVKDRSTLQPSLVVWNGSEARLMPRFDHAGLTYTPQPLDQSVIQALRLPPRAAEYGTIGKLFAELEELFFSVMRLPQDTVQRLVFYVIATWLTDQLPQAPFLWISAPPTAATDSIRQLLSLICRRVLSVPGLTLGMLRSLPMLLRPTIVTEARTVTPPLLKALAASSRRDAYIPSGNKLLDVFCAKVVFATEPVRDPAAAGFPLEVTLIPSREYVPLMSAVEANQVANEFQAKLLMYRLRSLGKLIPPALDLNEFTAPTQQLAVTLATCIVGDDKLRSRIIRLLKEHDQQIQIDGTSLLESMVIEALLAACHGAKKRNVSVIELTQSVNTILRGRGGAQEVSPEIVGWRVRAIGLRTTFLTGGRKGIALTDTTCATIHTLGVAYGVRTIRSENPTKDCKYCQAA